MLNGGASVKVSPLCQLETIACLENLNIKSDIKVLIVTIRQRPICSFPVSGVPETPGPCHSTGFGTDLTKAMTSAIPSREDRGSVCCCR